MKKKVLYILGSNYTYGGVEVAINSALPQLVRDLDFKLVCFGRINKDFVKNLPEEILHKNVLALGNGPFFFSAFKLLLTVKRELKNFKPDIIVLSLWKAVLFYCFLYLFTKGKRKILFIHSTIFTHFFDATFNKIGLKLVDVIFADSKSSQNRIKTFSNKPIKEISLLREKPGVVKEFRVDEDIIKLVSFSRIAPEKGYDYMLSFITRLMKDKINFSWDIYGSIGDELEKQKIETFINTYALTDHIKIKGPVQPQEIFRLMLRYDFFIQFSHYEGMAMSVAEAMSCGLVCLVHPVGEIPLYSIDMQSAVYIPELTEKGVDALYEKFSLILMDKIMYKKISENAILQFKEKSVFADSFYSALNTI